MFTRRDILKAGLTTALGAFLPGHRAGRAFAGEGLARFVDPLPIPPVLTPQRAPRAGATYYEVSMREFKQVLHRDMPPTTLWGYNGRYPGPTIVTRAHEHVNVRWVNDLHDAHGNLRMKHYLPVDTCLHGAREWGSAVRTVVHLHGGHVAPESDGFPEATLLPGQSAVFDYPNRQLAATLWYHDHALGITRLNMYMGLAGFYLIRSANERVFNLPAENYEIPLLIQDRSFNPDGSLAYPEEWQPEFFGECVLVNGKVWPYLEVRPRKYRFRLLNGSNTRSYVLAFDSGQPFYQIGTDGGFLSEPVELTALTLAPAERADVIVDFSQRAGEVMLTNSALQPGDGAGLREVLQFRVTGAGGDPSDLPARLRPVRYLREEQAVRVRELGLNRVPDSCVAAGFKVLIDNRGWQEITEYPQLGTTEIWSFINRTRGIHPIHLHLVQVQILDRQAFAIMDGQIVPIGQRTPPPPNEAGWKDTVRMNGFEITRVIAHFTGFTGRYPVHCHVLEHEDHEMMRQFEVVTGSKATAQVARRQRAASAPGQGTCTPPFRGSTPPFRELSQGQGFGHNDAASVACLR